MNKPFWINIDIAFVITWCLLAIQSCGSNLSDRQEQYKNQCIAQQNVIDSLAKVYRCKRVVIKTYNDFNGDPRKITLYTTDAPQRYIKLGTLSSGDSVQLIKVFPRYQFRKDQLVKILSSANVMVKTKEGTTGMIFYAYIQEFKSVLKEKGLETDTL